MDRRTFLKSVAGAGSLAAVGSFPAPAISQGAAAKALRFVPQANLANFDPIWGTQYVVRNASAMVWDTLYGVDDKLAAATADGGGRRGLERRPHLDVQAAARPQVPRRRAGAGQGRGGEPHALDSARLHGADDQGAAEGARCRRRPHRQAGAVRALSEDAVRARQEQYADRLHHAGADRQDRPVPADHRVRRQRADEVRARRVGAGRQGGVREVRRLPAAQRSRPHGSPAARRCWSTASSG